MGSSKKKTRKAIAMRYNGCTAVAALIVLMIVGCRHRNADPIPTAVQVTLLQREEIGSETRFSATVRERQRIELSFKVPGTVASLMQIKGIDGQERNIHEGDVVEADSDHPLARLDDSDYQRRIATAKDQLAGVQAKQRALTATLTAVRAQFDRVKALRERGSVAQQMYDDTLAKRDSTEAELEAVQREISGAGVALQQAEDDWKHCSLLLPIPKAVISRKSIEQGERVPAGQPVMEVMDVSEVRVVFGISDKQIGHFGIGQSVAITADAFPGEHFSGRVTKVEPAADPRTRTFEVEVTVDETKGLKPGMIVTITVEKRESVVLLPMTAVQRGENADDFTVYVVVDENGRCVARTRSVKLDGVCDNRIRLIEGPGSDVSLGDRIVSGGAFRVCDGQVVRMLDVPDRATQFDEP
jgi:multidrug efflux system membrane fusion protein